MLRFCLTLLRLLLAGWVGAAVLFVVVGVREITSPEVDSATRDALVLIRFPAYYAYGAGSLAMAFVCCLAARGLSLANRAVMNTCLALIAIAGLLMVADYVWIYSPLVEMLNSPGGTRPQNFVAYHEASKWINAAGLAVALLAAVLSSWMREKDEGGRMKAE